jgi:RNA polymerase sigma factor (sigma-70 family)
MDLFPSGVDGFRSELIRELVDGLPEPDRTVVSLLFFGQRTLQAISEELGIPVTGVKRARQRAFKRLRSDLLEGDYLGPLPPAAFE